MTQVAGLQAVGAEGQVIGTLSVDDLTELVATKIVQEAKNEAISARSASVMSEASTIAATDEYEDQLELDTNPAYVRSLDSDGNPKRTATTSLATVVGELLPVADASKNGLMSKDFYKANASYVPSTNSGKLTHLFNLKQYAQGCFYLKFGDTTNSNKISICIIDLNNRSQGSLSVISNKIAISERIPVNLYAKRNENNSIDVFVKQEVTTYPIVKFCWIHSPEDWNWTYVGTVSEVSESELTKIL